MYKFSTFNDFAYCHKCGKVWHKDSADTTCPDCNSTLYELDAMDFTLEELEDMFTNSGFDIAEAVDIYDEFKEERAMELRDRFGDDVDIMTTRLYNVRSVYQ